MVISVAQNRLILSNKILFMWIKIASKTHFGAKNKSNTLDKFRLCVSRPTLTHLWVWAATSKVATTFASHSCRCSANCKLMPFLNISKILFAIWRAAAWTACKSGSRLTPSSQNSHHKWVSVSSESWDTQSLDLPAQLISHRVKKFISYLLMH